MKNKTQVFILLLIMVTLTACRYDEGPMISFRSVEKRVIKGHSVVEFTKNNVDMTQALIDSCGKSWTFLSPQTPGMTSDHNLLVTQPDSSVPNEGYFDILSNKRNIEIIIYGKIGSSSYIGIEPFKSNVSTIWDIERLTKDEMWLSCTYSSADYYLKFK